MASFFAFPFSIFMRIVCVDDDHCCCCCYYLFVCVFVCLKHTVLLTIRRDLSFVTPQHVSIASSSIVGGIATKKYFTLFHFIGCSIVVATHQPLVHKHDKEKKIIKKDSSKRVRVLDTKKRGNEKSRELCCRT